MTITMQAIPRGRRMKVRPDLNNCVQNDSPITLAREKRGRVSTHSSHGTRSRQHTQHVNLEKWEFQVVILEAFPIATPQESSSGLLEQRP